MAVVNGNNERMLVEKLLFYYHRGLIPSDGNASVPIKVRLSLKLIQVFEINKRQVMSTSVWMKQVRDYCGVAGSSPPYLGAGHLILGGRRGKV